MEHDEDAAPQTLLMQAMLIAGLKPAELSRKSGVKPQQLSKLLHGQRELSKEWADKLAPALGRDPPELMFGLITKPVSLLDSFISDGSAPSPPPLNMEEMGKEEFEREFWHRLRTRGFPKDKASEIISQLRELITTWPR